MLQPSPSPISSIDGAPQNKERAVTVLTIQMLLACFSGERRFAGAAEADTKALDFLVDSLLLSKRLPGMELLADKQDMKPQFIVTERGRAMVDAILALKPPVHVWMQPSS